MSTTDRRPGGRDASVIAAVILLVVVAAIAVLAVVSSAGMGRRLADLGSVYIERLTLRSPLPVAPRRVQPQPSAPETAVMKSPRGPDGQG